MFFYKTKHRWIAEQTLQNFLSGTQITDEKINEPVFHEVVSFKDYQKYKIQMEKI